MFSARYHVLFAQFASVTLVSAQCINSDQPGRCPSPSNSFPTALKIVIPIVAVIIVVVAAASIYFRYQILKLFASGRGDAEAFAIATGGLGHRHRRGSFPLTPAHHHHHHAGLGDAGMVANLNTMQQANFAAMSAPAPPNYS